MNQWFFAGGDFEFYWNDFFSSLSFLPMVFRQDIGFGTSYLPNLWLGYPYFLLLKIGTSLGLSWWWIEKMVWMGVIILGIYSSYRLATYLFHRKLPAWISSIIYMTNTYMLLLLGGRQWGVALAYSLSPLVLFKFIQFIDTFKEMKDKRLTMKDSLIRGVWFGLLICCDLRLAYLVMGMIILYFVFSIWYVVFNKKFIIRNTIYQILSTFIIPLFIAGVMHLFWILPMLFGGLPAGGLGGEEYINIGMLRFLSVADFSHALSLLHPNWPENLFGKVYFLKPEFLMLPLLGFASLLFTKKIGLMMNDERLKTINRQNSFIIHPSSLPYQQVGFIFFFSFLALLGVFFAKGTQEPFGTIYEWSFYHIPGFVMFRDPTKFYLLIALGYSILIPFALEHISYWIYDKRFMMNDRVKNIEPFIFHLSSFIFIIFWCFTLRDIWTVRHMFAPLQLTDEYVQLKDMMIEDHTPYRTLWIPGPDKFFYSSATHPVLAKDDLWKNASFSAMLKTIEDPSFIKSISQAGVRYVIVPQDLEKRMFLSDYQFDRTQRDALVVAVTNTGLSRRVEFRDLAVFENTSYTFISTIPPYVEKQEYWSRIGLGIGGIGCIIFVGLWMVYKKKQ